MYGNEAKLSRKVLSLDVIPLGGWNGVCKVMIANDGGTGRLGYICR